MRILDNERYWAFFKAYLICFSSLVGLYVVIDAFLNLDEFADLSRKTGAPLIPHMVRYYGVRASAYYNQLCGIISMMAAIFTVTWLQKNNELLAMLAAGISTQRAIRPVLVVTVVVIALAVVNQEWIMPPLADELQQKPDDDGSQKVAVTSKQDANEVWISGRDAYRNERTIMPFTASFSARRFGFVLWIEAEQATYIPPGDGAAPMSGGWLIRGVQKSPSDAPEDGELGRVLRRVDEADLRKFPPAVAPLRAEGAPAASYEVPGPVYFLKTDITFVSVTRTRQWYQYASTLDLLRSLTDPTSVSERDEIVVFLHGRVMRPLLGLVLMFMSLPLVLGGEGRNMFINLGLSLGNSAVFYGGIFFCQYLGNSGEVSPVLSAWLPMFIFGVLAVLRWDKIRS